MNALGCCVKAWQRLSWWCQRLFAATAGDLQTRITGKVINSQLAVQCPLTLSDMSRITPSTAIPPPLLLMPPLSHIVLKTLRMALESGKCSFSQARLFVFFQVSSHFPSELRRRMIYFLCFLHLTSTGFPPQLFRDLVSFPGISWLLESSTSWFCL